MKIGLFGGSFNPVHRDHLTLARECSRRLQLDRLLLIPNASPPHKDTCQVSYATRRQMLSLCLRQDEVLEICDLERSPEQKHYSFQTCSTLREQYGPEARLFFIMGADSLLYLDKWYRGLEIITLTNLVVTNRVGYSLQELKPQLEQYVRIHQRSLPASVEAQNFAPSGHLYFLTLNLEEISSSSIRERLKQGERPEELPDEVYAYIRAHHLYE